MADRIYKGRLTTLHSAAFNEAAPAFDQPEAGGLIPFGELRVLLRALAKGEATLIANDRERIFVSSNEGVWVTIDEDGTIEIGASGV